MEYKYVYRCGSLEVEKNGNVIMKQIPPTFLPLYILFMSQPVITHNFKL
jgi:hypothetical protein